jgi:PAS domain S-box-containing protein
MTGGSADDDSGPGVESDTEDLYERAPCAYLSTLPDGTIVRANQTFFDWFGSSREEVLRKVRFQSLLTIGSRMYYETHYAPLLQIQGFAREISLEVRRPDGAVRPVVASAQQLRHPDGTPYLNRVALFDSTDRRKYEQELLQARKRAEQALRELANADRRKTEFIALLAHELRNPLAPIRNALELMRQDERFATETTALMRRQVGQMTRLVEDLFDISRIGQDKLAVHRVPVDLASVINHAVEASAPLFEDSGVSYDTVLPEQAIYAEADAGRLAQVVGNILTNGAKFTPRGGSVTVTLTRDGDDARVSVRDTGIGIAPEHLSRVFEMFMQTDVSLERRGGLGIGLTLAKTLIERHDGRIEVHSEGLGHGTEFIIRLPALLAPPQTISRTRGPAESERQPLAPRRVLVVDDNHDSATMMGLLIEFAGHEVRLAHDGLAAVDAAAAFQPHVVLLDIGLPRLNGYEAAQRIRKQDGLQPVLVALTGWGQPEDRKKSAAAGFDVHLVKPVDHDVLTDMIAGVSLDGRGA